MRTALSIALAAAPLGCSVPDTVLVETDGGAADGGSDAASDSPSGACPNTVPPGAAKCCGTVPCGGAECTPQNCATKCSCGPGAMCCPKANDPNPNCRLLDAGCP